MNIEEDVRLFQVEIYRDERGSFIESYNQAVFDRWLGRQVRFVQDNHSVSTRGVLRGLHYQLPPRAQAKLVRIVKGAVFDVVVDLRKSSPTFACWKAFELSEDSPAQLWIPEGFAHGFLALTEPAEMYYKTTDYYSPGHERSIRWDDATVRISWPLSSTEPILSPRDISAQTLEQAEVF